jgi:RNA polymerase sigma-70 factor (ECF subfamily)
MSPINDIREVDRHTDLKAIDRAVGQLPHRLRTVVIEVHFRDRSMAEAAWVLGISPATVRARLREALHELRKALNDRDAPEPC